MLRRLGPVAHDHELHVRDALGESSQHVQQQRVVLDRDEPPDRAENKRPRGNSDATARLRAAGFGSRAEAVEIHGVRDDLDPPDVEALDGSEALSQVLGDGRDAPRAAAEQAVERHRPAARGRRIERAVLAVHERRCVKKAGERPVEERRPLVGMHHVERAPPNPPGEAERETAIEARPAFMQHNLKAVGAELVAERSNLAETADLDVVASGSQVTRECRDHRLRPADREAVHERHHSHQILPDNTRRSTDGRTAAPATARSPDSVRSLRRTRFFCGMNRAGSPNFGSGPENSTAAGG